MLIEIGTFIKHVVDCSIVADWYNRHTFGSAICFPSQLDNETFRQVFNIRPASGRRFTPGLTHSDLHICNHPYQTHLWCVPRGNEIVISIPNIYLQHCKNFIWLLTSPLNSGSRFGFILILICFGTIHFTILS